MTEMNPFPKREERRRFAPGPQRAERMIHNAASDRPARRDAAGAPARRSLHSAVTVLSLGLGAALLLPATSQANREGRSCCSAGQTPRILTPGPEQLRISRKVAKGLGKVSQRVKGIEVLTAKAKGDAARLEELKINALLEDAHGDPSHLNQLRDVLEDLAAFGRPLGGYRKWEAGLKESEAARQKVRRKIASGEYQGAEECTDLVRGRIFFDTLPELYRAVGRLHGNGTRDRLHGSGQGAPAKIVAMDDRFVEPKKNGYVEVSAIVRLPSGHLAEIQFHLKDVHEGKALEDEAYGLRRQLEADLADERRPATPKETSILEAAREVAAVYPALLLLHGVKMDQNHLRDTLTREERDALGLEGYSLPAHLQASSRRVSASLGGAPGRRLRQPRGAADGAAPSLTELVEQSRSAEPALLALVDHWAAQLGHDGQPLTHDTHRRPLRELEALLVAPLEYSGLGGQPDRALDIIWGELHFPTLEALYSGLGRFVGAQRSLFPRVVRVEDQFARAPPTGDRQVNVYLEFANRHIGTVRFRLQEVELARRRLDYAVDRMRLDLFELLAEAAQGGRGRRGRRVGRAGESPLRDLSSARHQTKVQRRAARALEHLATLNVVGQLLGNATLFLHRAKRAAGKPPSEPSPEMLSAF